MRIKSAYITQFAGLCDRRIEFTSPYQLFYGENETGKTTVMRFIRMMLYGGTPSFRALCRPINGGVMSGNLIFESEGTAYQLDRTFGKSKSSDITVLTELTTGKVTKLSSNLQPGEMFLKISEDTFLRSCFVDQAGSISGEKGSEEIRSKLQNLVSSGKDDISVNAVEKHLNDAMRLLKNKNETSGRIAVLKQEQTALQKQLEQAKQNEDALQQYTKRYQELALEIPKYRDALAALQRLESDPAREDMLRGEIAAIEKTLSADGETLSRSELLQLKNELITLQSPAAEKTSEPSDAAALQAQTDLYEQLCQQLQQLEQKQKMGKQRFFTVFSAAMLLSVIICAVLFVSKNSFAALTVWILAILAGSVSLLFHHKNKQSAKLEHEQKELQCRKTKQDIEALQEKIRQKRADDAIRTEQYTQSISRIYRKLRPYGAAGEAELLPLLNRLIGLQEQKQEKMLELLSLQKKVTPQIAQLQEKLRQSELEYAKLNGILQHEMSGESVAQIEQKLIRLSSDIRSAQQKYDALSKFKVLKFLFHKMPLNYKIRLENIL